MFSDPKLLEKLNGVFSADTERFDELLAAAGLNPKTDLIGADLSGANFAGSFLDGWNLSGCNLTGASFAGARVRGLMTDDAIGLDLAGAEILSGTVDDVPQKDSDILYSIFDRIDRSRRGAERWPFIQQLLENHRADNRTWEFLLNRHLPKERVGRFVSRIIDEWESGPGKTEDAGNKLRAKLLGFRGNPYITVRARLIGELAARVGPSVEVLDFTRAMIESEGFLTSGVAAMSVLADKFANRKDAAKVLQDAISKRGWAVSKTNAVLALLKGFDGHETRRFVEAAILDASQNQRDYMMTAYGRGAADKRSACEFAVRVFETEKDPHLRAAAVKVRATYGDLSQEKGFPALREIASSDRDKEVRSALLRTLGPDKVQFVLERAVSDSDENVRIAAIYGAEAKGFRNGAWSANIFERDPSDNVRSTALWHLLSYEKTIDPIVLRNLLKREIARSNPGRAATSAGAEALRRWPEDTELVRLVSDLSDRLPDELSAYRYGLTRALETAASRAKKVTK